MTADLSDISSYIQSFWHFLTFFLTYLLALCCCVAHAIVAVEIHIFVATFMPLAVVARKIFLVDFFFCCGVVALLLLRRKTVPGE